MEPPMERGQSEKTGLQIWNEFNKALDLDRRGKASGLLTEGYVLFGKATQAYDAGIFEGAVLLCRTALESTFLLFLSIRWHDDNFFNIDYPTSLDGKPRRVEFDELRSAVTQRLEFSKAAAEAINRIHEDGNFVAHWAARKIKQRFKLSEELKKWEAANNNVTGLDRIKAVMALYKSILFLITSDVALRDLRDTSSIMLTVCNAMGKRMTQ